MVSNRARRTLQAVSAMDGGWMSVAASTLLVHRAGGNSQGPLLQLREPHTGVGGTLHGRDYREVPARAAQVPWAERTAAVLAACAAAESAMGIEVGDELQSLRRLMLCGAWISAHARHIYLFQAVDLLGYATPRELAYHYPQLINRGRRLSRAGRRLLVLLGGALASADNVVIGGFRALPKPAVLAAQVPELLWAMDAARATVQLVGRIPFPRFDRDSRPAMVAGDSYIEFGDRIVFDGHEQPVAALFDDYPTMAPMSSGPLARVGLGLDRMLPISRRLADDARLNGGIRDPFKNLCARAVEIAAATEQAVAIIAKYRPTKRAAVPVRHRAGVGSAAAESPQGPVLARCTVDDAGLVQQADMCSPMRLMRSALEQELRAYLSRRVELNDESLLRECRHLVAAYDPALARRIRLLQPLSEVS